MNSWKTFLSALLITVSFTALGEENPEATYFCDAYSTVSNATVGKVSIKLPDYHASIYDSLDNEKMLISDTHICGVAVPREEKKQECSLGSMKEGQRYWGSLHCNKFNQQPHYGPESVPPYTNFEIDMDKKEGRFICTFGATFIKTFHLKNCVAKSPKDT